MVAARPCGREWVTVILSSRTCWHRSPLARGDELGDRRRTRPGRSPRMSVSARHLCAAGELRVRLGLGPGLAARPPRPARPPAARSSSVSASGRASRAASSPASGGAAADSAATTGSDFFLARRSERTGLPVTSGAPQMPSRSSVSWNARPDVRAERRPVPWPADGGAPAWMAPMLHAHAISAAVLSPGHRPGTQSAPTSSRFSKARSAPWPGDQPLHRGGQAPGRPHAPAAALSSSSRSWASASSASPARMAAPTPNTVQAVGRCLALGVAVHDVVVQQGEVVHQLHGHRRRSRRARAARRRRGPTAGRAPGRSALPAPVAGRVALGVRSSPRW